MNWRCSAEIESRWQWTLKVHPGAGHDLPLDDPDWILKQLESWLPDC